MTEEGKRYLLLQLNDSLFPVGSYSHSYGLETYIQKNLVKDQETAARYVRNNLLYEICPNELLAVRMAYEAAQEEDMSRIFFLDELVTAARTPKEVRAAGEKMGSRFLKTVAALPVAYEKDIFLHYAERPGKKNYTVIYGTFCAAAGIREKMTLEHYLYAQTSAIVTNCVKAIPLRQTVGQKLLFSCQEIWPAAIERVMQMTEEEYGSAAPGFELRCMQHEGLYSRLYMS